MDQELPLDQFEAAKNEILAAKRILIISHFNPDADAIGANLALREALRNIGKVANSACIHTPPLNCNFLKDYDEFLLDFKLEDYDLFISVDCGGHKLLGFHEEKLELLDRSKTKIINIDHHPSNDQFGNINIVMPEAPATCFILYLMFNYYGWSISSTMATALLHGLYYDTGSFMHSNTSPESLRIAARLKSLGGDHQMVVKKQFNNSRIEQLRLWGRVLSKAHINEKQAVVSAATEEDYQAADANMEDLSGVINYLNHVPEAKFCMLLTEDMKGNIKGSFRTQNENIDLSEIAGLFGGGGHKKAAGFTIPGRLRPKMTWSIE